MPPYRSTALHFVKTAETGNQGRWRRHPRRRESGQLLLRLRFSFVRGCASAELAALTAAPNASLTSGRPCSALGLTARPVVADCQVPMSHGPALRTPVQK